jgi:beta-lactam-binding protein with PASTA domain
VKVGRKVYIKINSSGFSSVKVPDLIEKRIVEAVPTLKALGLEENDYVCAEPWKDMVLEMRYKGRNIKPGMKS